MYSPGGTYPVSTWLLWMQWYNVGGGGGKSPNNELGLMLMIL